MSVKALLELEASLQRLLEGTTAGTDEVRPVDAPQTVPFDVDALRRHVGSAGEHMVTVEVEDADGPFVHLRCRCGASWMVTLEALVGLPDAVLGPGPGAVGRLCRYVNGVRNPTAWERLGEEDESV